MKFSRSSFIRFALLSSLLLPTACERPGDEASQATPASNIELTAAVAASMRYAFDEIISVYQTQHPEISIEASYGSSGSFYAQLSNRAPFDLFLSADAEYPAELVRTGHADADAEFSYAEGRLVLWAPKANGLDVAKRGMDSLNDPKVQKISIANPDLAPYGRAAESALRYYQIDPTVTSKLVRGENIGQAAQYVQSGAAQIGLIAYSLATIEKMQADGDQWLVPGEAHEPLLQSGVILPWTEHRSEVEALRDFILGADGQAILKRHGFGPPRN